MTTRKNWGHRPWTVDFRSTRPPLPANLDFAVIGGGFTGLAAAAWLKTAAPRKSVGIFESRTFGSGSSGHSGGVALAESAVGDLPGLGDVLLGYSQILAKLEVDAELILSGAYELGRSDPLPNTPFRWRDSGDLCVVKEVPGGTVNPGKVVSGLARAAQRLGVLLFENTALTEVKFSGAADLTTTAGTTRAAAVLFATNAYTLELNGLEGRAQPAFTTAVLTEPLSAKTITEVGLIERKPFYTVDLPYLWGRFVGDAAMFGSGLVFCEDSAALDSLDITAGEALALFESLEKRVTRLHPALRDVKFTHRWGGPICIAEDWKPVFERHPESDHAIVLGCYSGHGVAQSVYLGAWAAEALLGRKELPNWK